jgi:hypothetical protein
VDKDQAGFNMSITFKRPMFRMGGQAGGEDTGITSGLRQQYQVGRLVTDESSPYANYPYGVSENSYANPNLMGIGSAANMYGLLNGAINKAAPDKNIFPKTDNEGEVQPVSIEDKLARIMKQYEVTPEQDLSAVISGLGQFGGSYTLGEALQKAAEKRNQIIEPKIQRAQDIKTKLDLLPIEQGYKEKLKAMETKGQIQFKEKIVDNFIDKLKENAKTQPEKDAIENNRVKLKFEYLVQGSDISDLLKISTNPLIQQAARSSASRELKNRGITSADPNYDKLFKDLMAKNIAESVQSIKQNIGGNLSRTEKSSDREEKSSDREEKADGGMMNEPIQTSEQQTEMQVSPPTTNSAQLLGYDELRARLPKEISNDIVKLLSISYQAFADFAEIATQSDVDKFNLKYGVSLVLPRGA